MSESIPVRVIERIRSRLVASPDGCWIWPGANAAGYGRIGWNDSTGPKWIGTHRAMYIATVGPIGPGLDIDHLCHDPARCRPARAVDCPHRRCCNPAHLRPTTRRENLLRGGTLAAAKTAVTHCTSGHAYEGDNVLTDKLGRRSCKTCTYERNRAYYWANAERRKAYNKERRQRQSAQPSADTEPPGGTR